MIDFRTHDTHEHGLTLDQRLQQPVFDLRHAQHIREQIHEKQETEAFAAADKRMKVKPDVLVKDGRVWVFIAGAYQILDLAASRSLVSKLRYANAQLEAEA